MQEYRILSETFLTSNNTIFVKGEYEGKKGVDYTKTPCADCATKYPSFYFQKPEKILGYAQQYDPIVCAFYDLIKDNPLKIMYGDIKYKEFTWSRITQVILNNIPDLLDLFFTDMPMPYGGFGPSYFVKDIIPDIDTNHLYYVSPKNIDKAILYFEEAKNDDTPFPNQIIKSGL
jgi:hypothetical protein